MPRDDDIRSNADRLVADVLGELRAHLEAPLSPGLYLVATPIGNLGDISVRALATLANAGTIYCEDTRHSTRLTTRYHISTPLRAYHEHNAERVRPQILSALEEGRALALISDAGTPLISDPGFKLVRAAIDHGHPVTAVPGPCAAVAALSLSGLATDRFLFEGFLPPKTGRRRDRLAGLADEKATLILYESPNRLAGLLTDAAATLGGDRKAVVTRELTKLHEEIRRGTLDGLAEWAAATPPRGEVTVVIAAPEEIVVTDAEINAALSGALATMSLRDAAREIATRFGVSRKRVYALGLELEKHTAKREN